MASSAAIIANVQKRSIFLKSCLSTSSSTGRFLTSAATLTFLLEISYFVILSMPHFPSLTPAHISLTVLPIGVTAPTPVITTRLIIVSFL